MLHHHDSRDYETAAADAAAKARTKLEAIIEDGRTKAASVIARIQTEQPRDRIVRGDALTFRSLDGGDVGVLLPDGHVQAVTSTGVTADALTATRHARGQLCSRVGLPIRYANDLRTMAQDEEADNAWAAELLAHNLSTLYSHRRDRVLLREYEGQLRGVLSDRFRRLDSRPLVDAMCGAAAKVGLMPCGGEATDSKVWLKAMLPRIYEPVPNEVMAFGLAWQNSDYGNGTHTVELFALRLWCTNTAIIEEGFRQVHLGKRLSDDFAFSQRTYELDTQAAASALQDVVTGALSEQAIDRMQAQIKAAHEQEMTGKQAGDYLNRLKSLTKGERTAVAEAFNSPDVEMLPAGNTMWRMSNAISWVAGQTEDAERALELQKQAGAVLPSPKRVKALAA